ncbi:MAG TPA: STAS domain-containing protein [Candidatus Andersenbacteria bacterium]|nr:STAS domain-containing protein [Candidatus Andersenbacteria bacterium]
MSTPGTQLHVEQTDVATIIRFSRAGIHKILDEAQIGRLGDQLFQLADKADRPLILDFTDVVFISSAFMGKLITTDKKTKQCRQPVILCAVVPEIYEVFAITRLNKLFAMTDDLDDALAKAAQHCAQYA